MKKLVVLFLFAATTFVSAQTNQIASLFNKGMIRGVLVDSLENSPLPSANITLHYQNDSSFAGGISSGLKGEFILKDITEGSYYLKISYIGYENKYVSNIKINESNNDYNMGVVRLSKSTLQLKETQVLGERASEELHLDKKVINVGQNLNASGGTALDVLQDQPSVRVDPDGTVYLRGSSDFKVLINGKPSVLQGADALKQISANIIDNIELITNPSAKYDAEGSAGIINIILKKQKEYSLSGIANLNSGTKDKYNGDFSINYNVNGLNFTGGIDYRDNAFFNDQGVDRTSFSIAGDNYNSTQLFIRDKRKQYTARAGLDYMIDKENSLSVALSRGEMDIRTSINSNVDNRNSAGGIYLMNESSNDLPVKYFNSNFNYSHKFNPEINELVFEATYSNVSLPSVRNSNEYSTDPTFTNKNANPSRVIFSNGADRNEGRLKLNFSQKIDDKSKLEIGSQSNFSYRNFNIENKLFDWTANSYIIDYSLTNKFDFKNNVYAGFVSYNNSIIDVDYMLGLRAEYTDRLLEQKTMNGNYKYDKMDYFPSVNISKKIGDNQLQFSYSRRINRPNENLLNPFPFYSDSYLTSQGNPQLLPEYINSFELNYQRLFGEIFFSVQTYYRSSNNSIIQTFKVDDNGKMNTSFENFGTRNTYGSEISSSFKAGEIFKFDPGVNLYGSDLSGNVIGMNVKKSNFNWTTRLNTTIMFAKDFRMQISGNYFGKIDEPQMQIKPFFMLTASIKKEFFDNKFSVTLQGSNLLKTSNLDISSDGTNFKSSIFVHQEVPVISLMFSYNFNNFKKATQTNDNIDVQTGL